MKIAGLTGGIGTGKTTVAHMFEALGAVIIDSDVIARSYLSRGGNGYKQVVRRYGNDILDSNLEIKRQMIAEIVFKNIGERKWLEGLVHPYVYDRIKEEIGRYINKNGIIIIDVPLLFETGADSWLRPVIVVICNMDARIKRIQRRSPEMAYENIVERMHAQMPIEEKEKKADFVIDNSGSTAETTAQVKKVWDALTKKES